MRKVNQNVKTTTASKFLALLLALLMTLSLGTTAFAAESTGDGGEPDGSGISSSDSTEGEETAGDPADAGETAGDPVEEASGAVVPAVTDEAAVDDEAADPAGVPVPQAEDLTVSFVTDEHVTVDVYFDKDYTTPDETNVTSALVREKGSEATDNTGEGQVNFRVNVEEGYEYTITVTPDQDTGAYKNLKNLREEGETEDEDIWRITKIASDLTVTITASAAEAPEVPVGTEINAETVWSYLDDGTDPAAGLSERTGWTRDDYDVSGWNTGAGSFGAKKGAIADLGGGCTPAVLLNQYKADGNDIEAFFFRAAVNVADPAAVTAITGSVLYDDAATVYLNGTKIAGFDDDGITSNLQYGGSNASAPKTGTINITDAGQIAGLLQSGINLVAVEIHQGRASSSDVYFEMPSLQFSTEPVEQPQAEQGSVSISVGADETQRNFTWYCNQAGDGVVYLAKSSELVEGQMPEGAKAITATATEATNKAGYYSNQATVTGLESGTTYAYQLVNGETKSEIGTFTTGTAGTFSFAFAGDPQIGASGNVVSDTDGWEKSLNIIANDGIFSGVDFLLSAGDQVNTASNEDQYDGYLDHEALYSLPVATVVGNHDSSSAAYDEHFNVPNESGYGATAASADYYFVYNHVLFLVLNSNNTSTAAHKAFMEQAIAATAGQEITWKVVTFHHSIYSVASHATEDSIISRREQLVPVFQELDIDVVLMGHDHVYCRTYMMDGLTPMTDPDLYDDGEYSSITNPTGILYVTANSASGSKFYSIQSSVEFPYSRVMNQEQVPNVSRVDVSDSQFTITTYRTNDLSVVDTFTIYRAGEHEVTVEASGSGTAGADISSAIRGTEITLTAEPEEGYLFQGWEVVSGDVTIDGDKFIMPDEAVTVRAVFVHDHEYDGGWTSDETGHWHACTGCDAREGEAEHTFEWVTDRQATADQDGVKHEECSVCGYQRSVGTVIPATGGTTDGDDQPGNTPGDPTDGDDQPGSTPGDPTDGDNQSGNTPGNTTGGNNQSGNTTGTGNQPGGGQNGSKPQTTSTTPKTGDESQLMLGIVLLIVSCGGAITIGVYGKKKRG